MSQLLDRDAYARQCNVSRRLYEDGVALTSIERSTLMSCMSEFVEMHNDILSWAPTDYPEKGMIGTAIVYIMTPARYKERIAEIQSGTNAVIRRLQVQTSVDAATIHKLCVENKAQAMVKQLQAVEALDVSIIQSLRTQIRDLEAQIAEKGKTPSILDYAITITKVQCPRCGAILNTPVQSPAPEPPKDTLDVDTIRAEKVAALYAQNKAMREALIMARKKIQDHANEIYSAGGVEYIGLGSTLNHIDRVLAALPKEDKP